MTVLSLLALSVVAGFVGAMSGMGGGVVLVPALTLVGVEVRHAIALSMVSVIATSSGAAAAFVRDRITNVRVGMFLELFTIVGALAGARLTLSVGRAHLVLLFGSVLLASFALMVGRLLRDGRGAAPARGAARADRLSRWLALDGECLDPASGEVVIYTPRRAWLAAPLMLLAGGLAGLLGIGAGALKVIVFELVLGLPTKVSTSTSNLIIGVTALAGSSVYLAAGLVDPVLCAPVVLGVVAGALVGTRVLVRIPAARAQQVFLAVLLLLGLQMVGRGVRGWSAP